MSGRGCAILLEFIDKARVDVFGGEPTVLCRRETKPADQVLDAPLEVAFVDQFLHTPLAISCIERSRGRRRNLRRTCIDGHV